MRRNHANGAHIARAVTALLRDAHLLERAREQLCAVVWPQAVGQTVAAKCQVWRVRDGVAYVHCESPAWAQSLTLQQRQVVKKLNNLLGAKAIRSLRCSTAGVTAQPEPPPTAPDPPRPGEADLAQVTLSAAEAEALGATAANVRDRALRDRLQRAMEGHLRRRRWLLNHGYRACATCDTPFWGEGTLCYACKTEEGRTPP